ncbi:MAG TPA: EamA family transporter [Trichormus sp.]
MSDCKKNGVARVPPSVWLGLALAIALDTGVQLCWKQAVLKVSDDVSAAQLVLYLVQQPLAWATVTMFFLQLFNWMRVLARADLSFAQPITSLSYISVCILSAITLHETVTVKQCLGISLILTGVWFISRTQHSTAEGKGS